MIMKRPHSHTRSSTTELRCGEYCYVSCLLPHCGRLCGCVRSTSTSASPRSGVIFIALVLTAFIEFLVILYALYHSNLVIDMNAMTENPPIDATAVSQLNSRSRYAYVTLCGDSAYFEHALVLAKQLRIVGSTYYLIVYVTSFAVRDAIKQDARLFSLSMELDVEVRVLEPMEVQPKQHNMRGWSPSWLPSYQRLALLKDTDFDKMLWLDADIVIMHNVDELFQLDPPAVTYGAGTCEKEWGVNGGVMLLRPDRQMYDDLLMYLREHQGATELEGKQYAWLWQNSDQSILKCFLNRIDDASQMALLYDSQVPVLSHIYNFHAGSCKCQGVGDEQRKFIKLWHFTFPIEKPWAKSAADWQHQFPCLGPVIQRFNDARAALGFRIV
jgi:Glycosyl transferase family 8